MSGESLPLSLLIPGMSMPFLWTVINFYWTFFFLSVFMYFLHVFCLSLAFMLELAKINLTHNLFVKKKCKDSINVFN